MARARCLETAHSRGRVARFDMARTHLGRPVYRVSAYLVDGLLVDTGPAHARRPLLDRLGTRRVDVVAVTHAHEDHVGNIAAIQGLHEVEAIASEPARAEALAGRPLPAYRRHTWGRPDPGRIGSLPRRVSTRHHAFEVVPTPGHTAGDVSLVEPAEGWAFSGDLVLGVRQAVTMREEDLAATVRSLEHLLSFEPRVLFTGMRVFDDASDVLRARLAFLKQVIRDTHALRQQGLTVRQVRRRVVGREPWIHYWSAGEFGRGHFVRQALQTPPKLGTTPAST